MSIVTRKGDAGLTALMYGRRISKGDPRVEAYGNVDELNAALGLARSLAAAAWVGEHLLPVQQDLVVLMGELATHPADLPRYQKEGYRRVGPEFTTRIDHWIRDLEAGGISYRGWATPGATPVSAALDLARTICRRAERQITTLQDAGQLDNPEILVFLNRFSDLLWLMARRAESPAPGAPTA